MFSFTTKLLLVFTRFCSRTAAAFWMAHQLARINNTSEISHRNDRVDVKVTLHRPAGEIHRPGARTGHGHGRSSLCYNLIILVYDVQREDHRMIQMTMQVPDDLAKRIEPMSQWLPTIIELSLIGFKTMATTTASEVIAFLSSSPSNQEVLRFHVSDEAQVRLQRLLALNTAGMLSEMEQLELDELQELEHIIVMLKSRIAAESA
jgi:hypothetical protein